MLISYSMFAIARLTAGVNAQGASGSILQSPKDPIPRCCKDTPQIPPHLDTGFVYEAVQIARPLAPT